VKVGSLFSGIGGLDLGLERAGMEVVWQSEIDPYASRVLAKHWPHVPNLGDITKIDWEEVERVDLICGGFPCNDISSAHTRGTNSRSGLDGPQSGLWREFAWAVGELEPRWVVVENVASCWRSWLPDVRRDLWQLGYAHLPVQLSAGAFGAVHKRDRIFVVAHTNGYREPVDTIHAEVAELRADARCTGYWGTPPPRGFRVDDGVPHGMDRSRVLGAAVVPQVAEWLGRQIMETDIAYRESE
jgi:DNA (cytosine-5)-methyltransferase 1